MTYPQLAGTNVARDYVEFPSQLLEHWLSTPEVLNTYALHYQTGKPIPAALVKKIEKAKTFNQGFITVEYLSSALIDMKLHLAPPTSDPRKFEKETLDALGMPSELVMRHRTGIVPGDRCRDVAAYAVTSKLGGNERPGDDYAAGALRSDAIFSQFVAAERCAGSMW